MLPTMAITSLGLLMLLGRWAFASDQAGGFKSESSRQAATDVLKSLVHTACMRAGSGEFDIMVDRDWQCLWPRPSLGATGFRLQLMVTNDGFLDLSNFYNFADGLDKSALARKWHLAFFGLGSRGADNLRMPVMEVLSSCVKVTILEPFVAQFFWFLARQLEGIIREVQEKGSEIQGLKLVIKDGSISVLDKDLDEKLFAYVSCCCGVGATPHSEHCDGQGFCVRFFVPEHDDHFC